MRVFFRSTNHESRRKKLEDLKNAWCIYCVKNFLFTGPGLLLQGFRNKEKVQRQMRLLKIIQYPRYDKCTSHDLTSEDSSSSNYAFVN